MGNPVLGFCLFSLICWVSFASPTPGAQRVVIITPHVDAIRYEFGHGFAAWHQRQFQEAAEVDWRNVGGSSDALRFVRSEFASKPEGIGVDMMFGGGQEPYLVLAKENWSLPYQPPAAILAGIPQKVQGTEVYDPGYRWFAAALSSFGILQNTHLQRLLNLSRAQRWEDLTQPALFGWVGAGDPRNSGTMLVMYESVLQAYGWEKGWQTLAQIGGNVRKFDRVSSSTAKDVTLGETAYAFAIDFYGFSQIAIAGRSNLTFVLPVDFAALNTDGISILRGAPNLRTAQRFIDFVLSEDGQRLWFLKRGDPGGPQRFSIERMSIRPDFYSRYRGVSNIEFSPYELKQTFTYNSKLSGARREVLAAMLGALLVDPHEELREAWRAIIRRGSLPQDLTELGRTPLTETEVLALAARPWSDPAVRTARKIEWQIWARDKYRKLCASPSKT
jgi:ABC-type Fe3+ transport system substrate-binding protein